MKVLHPGLCRELWLRDDLLRRHRRFQRSHKWLLCDWGNWKWKLKSGPTFCLQQFLNLFVPVDRLHEPLLLQPWRASWEVPGGTKSRNCRPRETAQVYNVHTMKDEFMIVSGMPERNGDRHVSEIASMALDLLAGIDTTSVNLIWSTNIGPDSRLSGFPDPPPTQCKTHHKVGKSATSFLWSFFSAAILLFRRMGFHSGPAMGVVAGNNIPNYCIMSDTGNLARLVYF